MSKDRLRKSYKPLFIVFLVATITAGGVFMFSMLGKSQEERRNREYEVSLVETLKDSYEGVEEIRFSNSIIRIFQISYTPHSDNIRKRSRIFYL